VSVFITSQNFLGLARAGVDTQASGTDYLFEASSSMPLIMVFHEVAVNPKVLGAWTWPGQGAGRTTPSDLIKVAQ
jgi:hypothetical protein